MATDYGKWTFKGVVLAHEIYWKNDNERMIVQNVKMTLDRGNDYIFSADRIDDPDIPWFCQTVSFRAGFKKVVAYGDDVFGFFYEDYSQYPDIEARNTRPFITIRLNAGEWERYLAVKHPWVTVYDAEGAVIAARS